MKKFTTYIKETYLTEGIGTTTRFDKAANAEILADLIRLGGGIEFKDNDPKPKAVAPADQPEFGPKYFSIKGIIGMDPEGYLSGLGFNYEDPIESEVHLTGTKYATTWVVRKKLTTPEDEDGKKITHIGTHFINMSNPNNTIGKKWLTPNKLGLGGQTLTGKEIVVKVKEAIEKHIQLTDSVKKKLINCLEIVTIPGTNSIRGKSLDDLRKVKQKTSTVEIGSAGLTKSELATLSADFGEILAAVWATRNISFNKIHFPANEAEPLVDFEGYFKPGGGRSTAMQPVSVKSGGGSVTSMKNLTTPLMKRFQEPAFKATYSSGEQDIINNMLLVITNSAIMDGIIQMHKTLNTEPYQELVKVMPSGTIITAANIRAWLEGKNSDKVKKLLKPFYKKAGTGVKKAQWTKYDAPFSTAKRPPKGFDDGKQEGIIIGPLGISLIKIMNSRDDIRNVLVKAARSITLLQVNVDVKSETMKFKQGQFVDFDFNFKWQGSSTSPDRNRFGFQATVAK